jgi:prepilin-type N-terminal cleavage/methylation domain-containing protein
VTTRSTRRRSGRPALFGVGADQRGMTLIELMVAIAVFAVVASAVGLALGSALELSRNNRNRSVAANLAAAEMDRVRATDFADLSPGRVSSSKTLDGVVYTIHRDAEWVAKNATTGACDGPGGSKPAYLRVTVSALWPNMAGAKPVQSQTVISPPVGSYDPATGHLAVKVRDRDAAPSSGHVVTIDGPSGSQSQTTADGCAFFAYLDAGSYTVSLNSSGYVDGEGAQQPAEVVGVNVGGTSSVEFDYDRSASLALTLGTSLTYQVPTTIDLPVVVSNPGLLLGTKSFPGSGLVRTVNGLFPYPDGYGVWVGECIDNDPLFFNGTRPTVASDPGQVTTANVPMHRVRIEVEEPDGDDVEFAQVVAAHAPDSMCVSGYSITLGTTDDDGELKVSMPYGSWQLTVNTGVQDVTVDPTGNSPMDVLVVTP